MNGLFGAFKYSVTQTMREVEADMQTRVRTQGRDEDRKTGNMVWAEFHHFTARPVNGVPDPHLHAHCFAFNATWDEPEQRWKAGQFGQLKREGAYYEAVFHARFAKQLSDLGYGIERTDKGWEIAGVPQSVIEKFIHRAKEVEALALERGITTAKGRDSAGRVFARTQKRRHHQRGTARSLEQPPDSRRTARRWRGSTPNGRKAELPDGALRLDQITPKKAMDYAVAHCYERASVATENELLREALRHGVGVGGSRASAAATDARMISSNRKTADNAGLPPNKFWAKKGNSLISSARAKASASRSMVGVIASKMKSCSSRKAGSNARLSSMCSPRVIASSPCAAARAPAKQPCSKKPSPALRRAGIRCSPSLLRRKPLAACCARPGFENATTVAALLHSPKMQEDVRNGVLLVDEAGLLSSPQLKQVVELAQRQNCRVLLSGDTAQHAAVERGDALRLLENHAGLQAAELKHIRRQLHPTYRAAVADLRQGDVENGFAKLNALGAIKETSADSRYQQLAADYVQSVKDRKRLWSFRRRTRKASASPTEIRKELKALNKLGR